MILKQEISEYYLQNRESFFDIKIDAIFLDVHDKVQKWWKLQKEAPYLTKSCSYFNEVKDRIINNPILNILRIIYFHKIKGSDIEFSSDSIKELKLEDFVSDPNKRILNIIAKEKLLSAVKLVQNFETADFIDLNYLYSLGGYNDYLEKAITELKQKGGENNILVIHCNDIEVERVDELYNRLSSIMQSNSNKKIILITQEQDPLAAKFKKDYSDKYIETRDGKNSLIDLTNGSQNKLLSEGKVTFQGEEGISLGTLVDDGSKHLLDGKVLSDLINGETITIGSSLPSISDPNSSAYHKVIEKGINIEYLKDIQDDIFVVSGIDRELFAKKLVIENERGKIVTNSKNLFSEDDIQFRYVILDETSRSNKLEKDFEDLCSRYQKKFSEEKTARLIHLIEFQDNKFVWNRYYDPKFYITREFNKVAIDEKKLKEYLDGAHQKEDIFLISGMQNDDFIHFTKGKIASTQDELSEDKPIFILSANNEEGEAKEVFNKKSLGSYNIHWIQKDNNELIWKRSKGKMETISKRRKEEVPASDNSLRCKESELLNIIENEKLVVIADVPGMGKSTTLIDLSKEYKESHALDWVIKVNLRDCEKEIGEFKIVIDEKKLQDHLKGSDKDINIFLFSGIQKDDFVKQSDISEKVASAIDELSEDKPIFILSSGDKEREAKEISKRKGPAFYNVHWIEKENNEFIWKSNTFQGKIETILKLCKIDTVVNFLSKVDSKRIRHPHQPHQLLEKLLEHKLSSNSGSGIFLLLDGFDEIKGGSQVKPSRQDRVIELLKLLKENTSAKVLITTRPYEKEKRKLEDELSVLSYGFDPIFNDLDKRAENFIGRFWQNSLKLKYRQKDENLQSLYLFAGDLFDKSREIFGKELSSFIGVPLQVRMLAEAYLKNDKGLKKNPQILNNGDERKRLLKDLNFGNLYKDFVDRKYEIYFDEKNSFSNVVEEGDKGRLKNSYQKDHMRLAFEYYFSDESSENSNVESSENSNNAFKTSLDNYHVSYREYFYVTKANNANAFNLFFSDNDGRTFFKNKIKSIIEPEKTNEAKGQSDLNRIGIIEVSKESEDYKVNFIHRTFAEYFISELIFDRLENKSKNPSYSREAKEGMWKFLLDDIFVQESYKVIRNFINSKLSDKQLVDQGTIIHNLLEQSVERKDRTQLLAAIDEGLMEIVKFLLKNAPDNYVYYKDKNDRTPIHWAAKSGNTEIVKLLTKGVDFKSDPFKFRDKWGQTPIHWAATSGNVEVVKFLIEEKGANFKDTDKDRQTPILVASAMGKLEVVKYLIEEQGADFKSSDDDGYNPIYWAIRIDNMELVKLLINKGVDFKPPDSWGKAPNEDGDTLLHYIALSGNVEVVKLLIEKGANFDACNKNGNTALHVAAKNGHKEVVDTLLKEGANVDARSKNNRRPLHVAAQNGHTEVVDLLLKSGADVNAKTTEGYTPLHVAAQNGNKEVVEALLQKGANIEALDKESKTSLDYADDDSVKKILASTKELFTQVKNGDLQKTKDCLGKGAVVNAQDNSGWTPLHHSIGENNDITKFLLENGADATRVTNDKRNTALHLATSKDNKEVVKILIEHVKQTNPDKLSDFINARTTGGNTSLHVAAKNNNKEVVEILLKNGAHYDVKNAKDEVPLVVWSQSVMV